MASSDLYGVQTFVRDQNGRLAHGRFTSCKNADEARRVAASKVEGGHAAGSAAFLRRGSGEFDEGEAITLETYGAVPPSVSDQLPF
ncbi:MULTISPECIES: hypothetical protein [Methylorubrum]|uniref:hypothetical protein n=1 Tax=Methylorubrum TaxID=2282523 RepID=UPI00209C89E5|nr:MULTISPECIES: hypothetical protein [Methylorubrum]MCP1550668.1 hypothetical protein [Methylorubrum zatmanii]MCP1552719.1 hypothetical protein [Methylorubrum extorquens]MCP1580971.1 hypothetical protein [Methylorubrum extorquens]